MWPVGHSLIATFALSDVLLLRANGSKPLKIAVPIKLHYCRFHILSGNPRNHYQRRLSHARSSCTYFRFEILLQPHGITKGQRDLQPIRQSRNCRIKPTLLFYLPRSPLVKITRKDQSRRCCHSQFSPFGLNAPGSEGEPSRRPITKHKLESLRQSSPFMDISANDFM